MPILEISIAVTAIVLAVGGCLIKLLAQCENSRCTNVTCCKGAIVCERDVAMDGGKEVEMREIK